MVQAGGVQPPLPNTAQGLLTEAERTELEARVELNEAPAPMRANVLRLLRRKSP